MVVLDNALRFTLPGSFESVRRSGRRGGSPCSTGCRPTVRSRTPSREYGEKALKGFLMPRRFYDSVGELKQAVLHALRLLGAVEVQCSLGDT